ncbi:MAG: hypothetical protein ACRC10_09050 [Thermoguttaceae bacterium]
MIDVDGLVRQVLADLGFAQSVAVISPQPPMSFGHLGLHSPEQSGRQSSSKLELQSTSKPEMQSVLKPESQSTLKTAISGLTEQAGLSSQQKQRAGISPGELRLQVKVLTLSDLQEQLGNLRRLIVPEKTIITPSVRDELRKRNVELCFEKVEKTAQNTQSIQSVETVKSGRERVDRADSQLRVWLGLHLIRQEPSGLLEFLQKQYAISRQFYKCVLEVMDEAESALIDRPKEILGIVLTPHSALAMCAGNRHKAIRAVLGTEINLLQRDTREIGANLLVLDPNRSNPYKTRELVKTFLNEGPKNGPEYL